MPIDARPFLTLKTPSGAALRCGRPRLRPLALGITGGAGSVAADQPTHTLAVYVNFSPTIPADLQENAVVTVDTVPGAREAFRVLRNGIEKGAGVWTLHLRSEEGYVPAPVPGVPAPDLGYDP